MHEPRPSDRPGFSFAVSVTIVTNRDRGRRDQFPRARSRAGRRTTMTIQTPISEAPRMLNFADLFVDGCDTRFVMGAEGKVHAALPDGSFVQLDALYRGKLQPSEFGCEYGAADVPAAWYPERASASAA
jgi:hypothetical protein